MNPSDKEIPSTDQNFIEQLKEKAATRKKLEQNQMRKQGTMPRHLYKNICQTSNKYLVPIINDFINRWPPTLFKDLSVRKVRIKDDVVQFQIEPHVMYPVGHIESLELNNKTTKITVVCYGESSGDPFRIKIYDEALKLLHDLSAEFADLFGKPSSIPKPPQGSTLEVWFQYKLDKELIGQKISLKELAIEAPGSYGHIRKLFPGFRREHEDGEQIGNKM